MTILLILTAATFALMVFGNQKSIRYPVAALFVVVSFMLRFEIDVHAVRDFQPYFNSFRVVKYQQVPTELFFEPYRLLLFQSILLFGKFDDMAQITAVYYLHFAIVTLFFIWIAWLRDVSFEVKLILFLAFYPGIAFVWLRAGMAYMATAYIFYTVVNKKWQFLHYTTPAFHASSLPFLFIKKISNLRLFYKVIASAAFIILSYFLLETSYVQYINYKLERYADTGDLRTSTSLLIFHLANIIAFLYFAAINREFRTNFVILFLMVVYMMAYYVNPVTGLRLFPFVLIAVITERIKFTRYQWLSILVAAAYIPVYYERFNQIFT